MVKIEDIYTLNTTRLDHADEIVKELKSKLPSHKQGQQPDTEIAELLTKVRDILNRGIKAHARMEELSLHNYRRDGDLVLCLGSRVSQLELDVKHFEDGFR